GRAAAQPSTVRVFSEAVWSRQRALRHQGNLYLVPASTLRWFPPWSSDTSRPEGNYRHASTRPVPAPCYTSRLDEWICTRLGRSAVANASASAGRSSSGVVTVNPAPPQSRVNAAKSGLTRFVS